MNSLTKTDIYGYAFLIFVLAFSIYISNVDMNFFENRFTRVDGPVKITSAIMFTVTSLMLFIRFVALKSYKNIWWNLMILFFGITFLIAALYQISWGQKLFGNLPEEFKINYLENQNCINIFLIFFIFYFLILPIYYRKMGKIKNVLAKFSIPLVRWHHSIAFIIACLAVYTIPSFNKWDIFTLVFSIIFFLIFLNPHNIRIYARTV